MSAPASQAGPAPKNADRAHSPTFATVFRLRNFEDVSLSFTDWHGRIEQVSAGRFEGTLRVIQTSQLRVVEAAGTQRLRVVGRDGSGMLAIYPVVNGMAASTWKGFQPDPGEILVGGCQDETDITAERRFSGRAIFLHPAVLQAAARALLEADHQCLVSDSAVITVEPRRFNSFLGEVDRVQKNCLAAPEILGTPEGCLLEQECLRALVAALASSPAPVRLSAPSVSRMVERAKDYLRAHLHEPVGVVDLCREIGANDRTLRHAFHERFGVGPMTYFRFLRLNAVRARIRADKQVAIAEAAREFGFHHLGNFAADYRRLFGIRPSETER